MAMLPQLIHTCYRIGDIDRSRRLLRGARLRGAAAACRSATRRSTSSWACPATAPRLELTYNHGVDAYELGTGYNHIAITVEDLDGTLGELAEQGIEPEKPPYRVREGGSRLCFVRDPDGYRIELIEKG